MDSRQVDRERFDPRVAAERLRGRPVERAGTSWGDAPEDYFRGTWTACHRLNVPGPFYGGGTDTCCDGPPLAPKSLLYDEDGTGFVWRQPRDDAETHSLMCGASSDPYGGYGWDGDLRWTCETVAMWWAEQPAMKTAVATLVTALTGPRREPRSDYEDLLIRALPIGGYSEADRRFISGIVAEFVAYRAGAMRNDVQRFMFRLNNGVYPRFEERVPELPRLE